MSLHGGDGQERSVTHALQCFSPLYDDDDAGGREEDIHTTSVPRKVKLGHSPGCQVALVQRAKPAKGKANLHRWS